MLNSLGVYLEKIKHRYFASSAITTPGFCCININSTSISIAYLMDDQGKQKLQYIDSIRYKKENLASTLNSLVKQKSLEGVACSWILEKKDYQLLLMDSLPVPENEFQAAIRWKIKDMIQFPIEDAVIDSFPMPLQKTHDPRKMIIVAVARLSHLQEMKKIIEESGLNLKTIDVEELTLRNITSLYEDDQKTSALIYLLEKESVLIVTQEKKLYFYRDIDIELDKFKHFQENMIHEPDELLDKFALELQRSFDYYQSQWRQPAPARILLAAKNLPSLPIANYLSSRLAMSIKVLDLKDVIEATPDFSIETQGKCLFAIGGVLQSANLNKDGEDATED